MVRVPMSLTDSNKGVTLLEVSMALTVLSIMCAFAFNPMRGYLRSIDFRNSGENIKRLIQTAQSRAMANPNIHVGIYFDRTSKPNKAFLFQDKANPADYTYDGASDPRYLQPEVLKKGIVFQALAGFPDEIVFRGDGSAWKSMKILITDGTRKDTLDVLASTGRVRLGK